VLLTQRNQGMHEGLDDLKEVQVAGVVMVTEHEAEGPSFTVCLVLLPSFNE
jgi:hypothetical protein